MTAAEYREAIAALGLSQVGAAKLFGVNPRTSRRWALGEDIPRAVEIALVLMIRLNVTPNDAVCPICGKGPAGHMTTRMHERTLYWVHAECRDEAWPKPRARVMGS